MIDDTSNDWTYHIERDELPQPFKTESRIAFGIAWFTSEEDANRYAGTLTNRPVKGGGWYGRAPEFDYDVPDQADPTGPEPLARLYAVRVP